MGVGMCLYAHDSSWLSSCSYLLKRNRMASETVGRCCVVRCNIHESISRFSLLYSHSFKLIHHGSRTAISVEVLEDIIWLGFAGPSPTCRSNLALVCGLHTVEAWLFYCGLISEGLLLLLDIPRTVSSISVQKPQCAVGFFGDGIHGGCHLQLWSTWWFQDNLLIIYIPRYLAVFGSALSAVVWVDWKSVYI